MAVQFSLGISPDGPAESVTLTADPAAAI